MHKSKWNYLIILLGCLMLLTIVGCESKSDSPDTISDSSFTVNVSPASVDVGNTSVVEATLVTNSTGVSNEVVTFTVSPSDAGYFSPSVDTTDADGVAAAVFTATSSGAATISCSVSGTTYSSSKLLTVNSVAQTSSGNVSIDPTPSLLLANGSDTAQITITVRDANAQPAPDGTIVRLVAGEKFEDMDGSGDWSLGTDSLIFDANGNGTWDALGYIPSTATITGGDGIVTVDYISGNDARTVYVRATVDNNGIVGYAEIPLQVSADAAVSSIYLQSDTMSLVVKQTGGIETSTLHATAYNENGNPVPEGLVVSFVIIDGPGGGEHLGSFGYGPYEAITNSQGVAACPISSGTISGTIRVRAQVDTVLSNATQILVAAGPPAHIVVGADECNVPYWDNVNERVGIVAVVSDIYNNPVTDSTVVYFSTDEGSMISHIERTKDNEGVCYSEWISGNNVDTADGVVVIMAETAGGTVADTSFFINSHYVDTLIVTNVPSSIPLDNKSEFYVDVQGLDYNVNNSTGLPVVSGSQYEVSPSVLSVAGGTLENGCYLSVATSTIKSTTLEEDYSLTGGNDDGIGKYETITFKVPGYAYTTVTIPLTTGTAYSKNSTLEATNTSVGLGESVNLSALILDRFGNPLGDHTLLMSATRGTVTGASQETNGYGEAFGFVWTAPADSASLGKTTITVQDTDPRGGGVVLSTAITVE